MNNQEGERTKYFVRSEGHAKSMCTVFTSLLEKQSLVDVLIYCGGKSLRAHKCVLAANSPYFKEQLQKNPDTEQIAINSLDFPAIKAIIAFMYCGRTSISKRKLKYMIAAAKFFQMQGFLSVLPKNEDILKEAGLIKIEAPVFSTNRPKFADNMPLPVGSGSTQADPRPAASESATSNLNLMEGVPLQVVNYDQFSNNQILMISQEQLNAILGTNLPANVGLMYRTADGNLVDANLAEGGNLEYQSVEEHGEEKAISEEAASLMQQSIPASERQTLPSDILNLSSGILNLPSDILSLPSDNLNLPHVTDDSLESFGNENMDYHFIQTGDPSAQVDTEYFLNEGIISTVPENDVFNIEDFYNNVIINPTAPNDFPNISSASADLIIEDDAPDANDFPNVSSASADLPIIEDDAYDFLNISSTSADLPIIEGDAPDANDFPNISSTSADLPIIEDDAPDADDFPNISSASADLPIIEGDAPDENDFPNISSASADLPIIEDNAPDAYDFPNISSASADLPIIEDDAPDANDFPNINSASADLPIIEDNAPDATSMQADNAAYDSSNRD